MAYRRDGVDWSYRIRSTVDGAMRDVVVGAEFVAGAPDVALRGEAEGGVHNFYLGRESRSHYTGARDFERVRYIGVYPGVDALFGRGPSGIKYDFIVAPHADPSRIALRYRGAESVRIGDDGSLEVTTSFGLLREDPPYAYQEIDGRRVSVPVRFTLDGDGAYGFALGAYDRDRTLVIDPCLSIEYLTYLGGGDYDEVTSMAVDSAGNGFAIGFTRSANYPTIPAQGNRPPDNNVFVSKISPDGTRLIYSTIFGPEYTGHYDLLIGQDGSIVSRLHEGIGEDVEIDAAGNAVIGLSSNANGLPTTAGAYQPARAANRIGSKCGPPFADNIDLYLAGLGPNGEIVWGTYLGGGDDDYLRDLALDPSGNVAVTGTTVAARCGATGDTLTYPVTIAADSFSTTVTLRGFETFVSRLSPSGSTLQFSAYVGGRGDDFGGRIAAGADGDLYVVGSTNSTDLKTTPGAFRTTPEPGLGAGVFDLFLMRIDPDAASLKYSTYIPDNGSVGRKGLGYGRFTMRRAEGLPIDGLQREGVTQGLLLERDGLVLIGGTTRSTTLPTTPGALRGSPYNPSGTDSSAADAFLLRFDLNASRIVNATYLGGSAFDAFGGVALDADGGVAVGISTTSPDAPTTRVSIQQTLRGLADGLLLVLNNDLGGVQYGSYVGGSALSGARLWEQSVRGVVADREGGVYLYGGTVSRDLPYTPDALNRINDFHGGWVAKFVASLEPRIGAPLTLEIAPEACGNESTTSALLFNSGVTPLVIDSVSFIKGTAYRIISPGSFPIVLGPCDSISVIVGFDPNTPGVECDIPLYDTVRVHAANAVVDEVRIPIRASRSCVSFRLRDSLIDDPRYRLGSPRGYNVLAFVGGDATQHVTIEPDPANQGNVSLRSPWDDAPVTRGVISIDFDINALDTGRFCETFYLTIQPCNRRDTISVCAYVRSGFFNIAPDSIDLGVIPCGITELPTIVWNSGNDSLQFRVGRVQGPDPGDVFYRGLWDDPVSIGIGDTFRFTTFVRPLGYGRRQVEPVYITSNLKDSTFVQRIIATVDSVAIALTIPSLTGAYGDLIDLPITYEPVREGRAPLTRITFRALFDPNMLEVESVDGTGTLGAGWEVVESILTDDGRTITLAMGPDGSPLLGGGTLTNLRLRVLRGDTIASRLGIVIDGDSRFCLDVTSDTNRTFALSAECLAHERLVFAGNRMLKPPYPNPATATLTIPYRVPVDGTVTMHLFDMEGREVLRLIDRPLAEGNDEIALDARVVPPGRYFIRMVVNDVLTDVREVEIRP